MSTRRDFLKKTAYTAPVILTLTARPSFASGGSGYSSDGPNDKIRRSPRRQPKPKKEQSKDRAIW